MNFAPRNGRALGWISSSLLALALGSAPGWAAAPTTAADRPAPAAEQQAFADSIVVRELEVFFDDSLLPPLESLGRRSDADFLVFEAGIALESAPAPDERASGPPLRELLLWFDTDLATPAALAAAARALVEASGAFATAERIEVVVAEPRPRTVLATAATSAAVEELARRARAWERAADSGLRASAPIPIERRLRALDRLAAEIARRGDSGPRALVLAADGWSVDARRLEDLSRLSSGAAPSDPALVALDQAGRLLAAYGWVTFALAARPLPDPADVPRRAREVGRVGGDRAGGGERTFFGVTFPFRKRMPTIRETVRLDVATDFGLRPLAHLVRASSGGLAGEPGALAKQLARVANRRRLLVRAPERPPGQLIPLEVRWTGGDGRPLPSPKWLRSGLPPEAAAARLRALTAGDLTLDDGTLVTFRPPGARASARKDQDLLVQDNDQDEDESKDQDSSMEDKSSRRARGGDSGSGVICFARPGEAGWLRASVARVAASPPAPAPAIAIVTGVPQPPAAAAAATPPTARCARLPVPTSSESSHPPSSSSFPSMEPLSLSSYLSWSETNSSWSSSLSSPSSATGSSAAGGVREFALLEDLEEGGWGAIELPLPR